MKYLWLLLVLLLFGCAPKRFDWNNYCSLHKDCPPDQWCYYVTLPNGEPAEYGQCIDYEDD